MRYERCYVTNKSSRFFVLSKNEKELSNMEVSRHAHLLHNPKAGDGDHMKEELMQTIVSCGFTCQYSSTKEKQWGRLKAKTALVVIAGGDGTVRQVMKRLLARRLLDKRLTVAILPAGTANNFAKTLGASSALAGLSRTIAEWNVKKIDVGAISNVPDANFFLEGAGMGIFPKLIKEMKETDHNEVETADDELDVALDKLIEITERYTPKWARITVDGVLYEGDYLLVEVLNIKSVGPNLELAPQADPTDGKFQVALLKEADRDAFLKYLHALKKPTSKKRLNLPLQLIEARQEITITADNRLIHVDDELIAIKRRRLIKVEVRPGIIDVIV
ncbi:Diacylglycerol kinase family enzyme [Parapedobacter luteus]|uniref:Diacylglycerol kinase family enzyme n=2 Tax=Parapedobacter luteus TaxID=623280 RepID=A0A1T5AUL6_9SPHI|nr:Diacylglycerol kinase family enzyme [Parapedobacter luteus]